MFQRENKFKFKYMKTKKYPKTDKIPMILNGTIPIRCGSVGKRIESVVESAISKGTNRAKINKN